MKRQLPWLAVLLIGGGLIWTYGNYRAEMALVEQQADSLNRALEQLDSLKQATQERQLRWQAERESLEARSRLYALRASQSHQGAIRARQAADSLLASLGIAGRPILAALDSAEGAFQACHAALLDCEAARELAVKQYEAERELRGEMERALSGVREQWIREVKRRRPSWQKWVMAGACALAGYKAGQEEVDALAVGGLAVCGFGLR